jgi:SAM-dependent methyltransferase
VPANNDVWSIIADRYEEAYGPKAASPGWPRAQQLAARVDGRILDLACGPGFELALFTRGVGVDSSPAMVAAARRRASGRDLVLGDIRALPFRDASFAGAHSSFALIHMTKRELASTLRQLRVMLRPRAPVVATFFTGRGEKDTTFSFLDDHATAHYAFYQPAEIAALFESAGFVDVSVDPATLHEPKVTVDCLCVSASTP